MKRVLGILAAAGLAIGLAAPAHGAVSEVGWFTRNPAASAPPEGGIQVANSLDGRLSFGALRAGDGSAAVLSAQLTLKESGQGVNAAGASLQACPAAGSFKAGKGTFADGPKADCATGTIALRRDAASGQWSGDVTSILASGDAAIAIVPGDASGVFQINFEAPALTVQVVGSSGGGGSNDFDASEFNQPPAGGSSSSPSPSSSSSFEGSEPSSGGSAGLSDSFASSPTFSPSGSSFSAPAAGTATTDPTAPPAAGTEVTGGAAETAASSPRSFAQPTAAIGETAGGNRTAQFLAFLLTAAIIGTIAGVTRNRLTAA